MATGLLETRSMSDYRAPIAEMRFVLREIADLEAVAALPGYSEATPELADAALEEAGRLAAAGLAPLNHRGDLEGARRENGVGRPRGGFQAYRQAESKTSEGHPCKTLR